VWVSSDGALVLPIRTDGEMKAVVGSRICMSASICNFCNKGDTGTITAVRESKEDAPGSWFVTLDGGCDSYIFDGEFEVVGETAKTSLGFPTPTHIMRWSEPWKALPTQKPI
jgi:hypothetical protein